MLEQEYNLVEAVQSSHWWWLGREKLLRNTLKRFLSGKNKVEIADIGCGFGANIPMLRSFGDVTALELKDEARQTIERKWMGSVRTLAWAAPQKLDEKFDVALMADVLEHIPDDVGAVNWLADHINPGGYVFITVPAHMSLWTQMDDVLHHHRRYTKSSLTEIFGKEFKIVECRYYNFFLFPAKWAFVIFDKVIQAMRPNGPRKSYNNIPPFGLNKVFEIILKSEILLFSKFGPPNGISLLLIAKRVE
tara:strand:- start:1797 stop:2540 length:744 start_codon:yes stop_codon:yes gene_type:complete